MPKKKAAPVEPLAPNPKAPRKSAAAAKPRATEPRAKRKRSRSAEIAKTKPYKIAPDGRRYYTPDERANFLAALVANGGNVEKTAREVGVPAGTLQAWKSGARCPEALLLRDEKKGDLANAAEELAWLFAATIPEKVPKAPLNHLTAGFGIMVEKVKLLRGEPTSYGKQEVRSASFDVARLAEVLAGLPEHERVAVTRFLDALRGGTVRPVDPGTGGHGGSPGDGEVVPRPLPAVLG